MECSDHGIAKGINYDGNKNYGHYLNKEIHSSFTLMNIDEAAINKIIYNLPPKSSSGCDGISSKLLKVIAPAIIKQLTMLINHVLNTGTFPDKLKIVKVIPIFKKGDPSLFENYRPISLFPAISKVLEKIIALQLSSYFETNKLLFDNQYGFRPKHSTEHAALELIDRIINKMDTHEIPLHIFIDLSKAFDTIDHTIVPRTSACYMFPIKRGACMGHVPSSPKCLRNDPPFCFGGRTLDALVLELVDDGLVHFTNTHIHGIVRHSKVELHAGVPVPGSQVAHCHSQLQTWFEGFSIRSVLFGD